MELEKLLDADMAQTALIRKERARIIVDKSTTYDDLMRVVYEIED
jgi:hypothetical protein